MVAVGRLPTLIVIGVDERAVDAVRDGEPGRVHAGLRVGVGRVGRGRRGVVAERPRVRQRLTFGVGRTGAREVDGQRSRPDGRIGRRRPTIGAWFDCDVPDPADLADAEGAADVGVAEVDVVERAVRALGQIDDVAVRAVDRSVGRLEVERRRSRCRWRRTSGAGSSSGCSRQRSSCPGSWPGTACRGRRSRR